MATAEQFRDEFQKFMDSEGIKYSIRDEKDNIVRIMWDTNVGTVELFVDFDEDGDKAEMVHLVCPEAATPLPDKQAAAMMACNEFNEKRRWVKFYVSSRNGDVMADTDAILSSGTAGRETYIALRFLLEGVTDFREAHKDILKNESSAADSVSDLSPDEVRKLLDLLRRLGEDA